MEDTRTVQRLAEVYQKAIDTSAGTRAPPETFKVNSTERKTTRGLLFSKLEIALINAVVIFAILSLVFILMSSKEVL